MKRMFLLLLYSYILFTSCTKVDASYVIVRNVQFNYGPVNIKVDSEWLIEKSNGNFIRLGFGQDFGDYITKNGDHPVSISKNQFEESNYILENELDENQKVNIVAYDIPMIQNQGFIDIDLFVDIRPPANNQEIHVALRPKHRLYIYNPVKYKWFSLTEFDCYIILSVIELMDEEFFNKELKTVEEYWHYKSKQSSKNSDPYYVASILEKRVIKILPSDTYEKNFKDYFTFGRFCWWKGTELPTRK
ncbi:MAG: hypothetical protein K8S87_10745 [Planctomycetes bacterium]|nr:hypothetical protein [Planctomycetota bacterium]